MKENVCDYESITFYNLDIPQYHAWSEALFEMLPFICFYPANIFYLIN